MNFFKKLMGKKKVKSEDNPGEPGENKGAKKKKNSFKTLKKKIRITIKRRIFHDKAGDDDEEQVKDKKKKKKPRKKKQAKDTGNAPVGNQPGAHPKADDEDEGNLHFPIIPVAIVAAAIILGGSFFGATVYMNRPSDQELLLRAALMKNDGKYSDAQKIYRRLIKKDETLVQAHLGFADSLVGMDKVGEAVDYLKGALELTGNSSIITAKIDLLIPMLPPDQQPPDGLDSPEHVPGEEAPAGEGGAAPPVPDVPIVWKDAALERAVRRAMDIPEGKPVTQADAAQVTSMKILGSTHSAVNESLNAFNRPDGYEIGGVLYSERGGIRSLDDLANFKNLKKLIIGYNSIEDISGVAWLSTLDTLGLYFNDVSDISPLMNVKSLRFLYLYNNKLSDISPISELSELRLLWLTSNGITDISAVRNLRNLTELYISNNQIADISAVSGLSELGFFYADGNQIQDISPIAGLASLTDVSFKDNPISDRSPAKNVANADF